MSKMKHLLKKLHIGGGGLHDHHHGHTRLRPNPNPNPNPNPSPNPNLSSSNSNSGSTSSSSSSTDSRVIARIGVESDSSTAAAADFNFLEEEFQVQLALAISASSADHVEARVDPDESAQIDAAKRISLGCSAVSAMDSDSFVEFLSLRYWTYNVVNYDEKIMDGFYDAYGIQSSTVVQGKMPLLMDLQAISVSDSVDYEVILVNRLVDADLQQLEQKAIAMSRECQVAMHGPKLAGLVQNIADMVVQRMGGPVSDADEMVKRWTARSYELRSSLNTNILPLGALDVGLSRHRALLFKVLADKIDLPCKLVKGSYYTGTDDGAVNLIEVETGSEYIIDLMGAPGALIPAEVPSIYLPHPEFGGRVSPEISFSVPDQRNQMLPPTFGSSRPIEEPMVVSQTKRDGMNLAEKDQTERFEHDFGNLLPSLPAPMEGPSSICGKATPAQKMQVNSVSKYVISAAKNPEFAQKLHAVLLESGASPPADLFSDVPYNQQHMYETQHLIENNGGILATSGPADHPFFSSGLTSLDKVISGHETEMFPHKQDELNARLVTSDYRLCSDGTSEGSVFVGQGSNDVTEINATGAGSSHQRQVGDIACGSHTHENNDNNYSGAIDDSKSKSTEKFHDGMRVVCNGHPDNINPMLGEAAEWDIKWEDLQIGERIGIGSYGEVYRAEWNGTEVAVKKFLDQDFSGDALVQFKYEIEIMLRLRHPNVVLFMGAVTQSPHFSILTEFLPRGSLYRLLHRPNSQLEEKRRMRMALDVAKGMNYLHTSHPTIVHRDLKSPNLLVDKNWLVKVCDFGLSRMKHHTFLSSKSTAGTPEWMAPEVLRNEPANEKCDVYSFGVILWELATLGIPWKGLNPMQVVGAVGFQNRRLEIPEDVDPTVAQIIQDCWQTEPHLRPSFTQLMHRLRRLQHLVVDKKNSTG